MISSTLRPETYWATPIEIDVATPWVSMVATSISIGVGQDGAELVPCVTEELV